MSEPGLQEASDSVDSVLVCPPFQHSPQRYGSLLYNGCTEIRPELRLIEGDLRRIPMRPGPSIIHLHWPESLAGGRFDQALVNCLRLQARLRRLRRRGTKVVWTVHNHESHDRDHPLIERLHISRLLRCTDGLFFLSEASRHKFITQYRLRGISTSVVRIGPYSESPGPRKTPRPLVEGDRGCPRILFFGSIRPYKGLDSLLVAAAELGCTVRVLGRPEYALHSAGLRALHPESVLDRYSDFDLEQAAGESDLAVFPFRQVTNSSSVMHALSLGLPVVVPDFPAFREIQSLVGRDWVRIYSGSIMNASTLEAALQWTFSLGPGGEPDLRAFDWSIAAQATLETYDTLVRK